MNAGKGQILNILRPSPAPSGEPICPNLCVEDATADSLAFPTPRPDDPNLGGRSLSRAFVRSADDR